MVTWEWVNMITPVQEKIVAGASYAASGAAAAFGLWTVNEVATVIGIVLAIGTFIVNWIYKHKHYRLTKKLIEDSKKGGDNGGDGHS